MYIYIYIYIYFPYDISLLFSCFVGNIYNRNNDLIDEKNISLMIIKL